MKNTQQPTDFSSLKEGIDYPPGMPVGEAIMFIKYYRDFPDGSVKIWTEDQIKWEIRGNVWVKIGHDPILPCGEETRICPKHVV